MGRYNLKLTSIDAMIILKWILKLMLWDDVDWIHLAQAKNECWAAVRMVINPLVISTVRKILSSFLLKKNSVP
jgi:hypothetical protein